MRFIFRFMLLVASLALSIFPASTCLAQSAVLSPNAPPSDQQLTSAHCIIGEEKPLPGDYYYCLGSMVYGEHQYANARRFFTTAASWASKPAEFVLGIMALDGDHQPRDVPLALAWLSLASQRPSSRFEQAYDQLLGQSSSQDRSQEKRLLSIMRLTYADDVAANRAEQRYQQGMDAMRRINNGGSDYCMEGMIDISTLSGGAIPNPEECPKVEEVMNAWAGHVTGSSRQNASRSNQK